MNQRKEKSAKDYSVAARRKIKWKQLKAEHSTLYARYRGKAARSHENPPALTHHLHYKGGAKIPPLVKGGRGDLFRPTIGSVAERAQFIVR